MLKNLSLKIVWVLLKLSILNIKLWPVEILPAFYFLEVNMILVLLKALYNLIHSHMPVWGFLQGIGSLILGIINPFLQPAVALVLYFTPKWVIVLAGVAMFLEAIIISAGLFFTVLRIIKLLNPLS